MHLNYYPLLLFFNYNFVSGFGFFDISNTFKHLNEELNIAVLDAPFSNLNVKTRWIEQKLDHFDSRETRTWKMRYFERLDLWRMNGPIYVFLGGESPASSRWTETGTTYELAKETRGAIYVTEHRYYGESKPLDATKDTKNFKFLSSRQALADVAVLIKTIKSRILFKDSKVVVVGGSYAGNLAAWMRLLYPELVDAGIASSGPVLAKVDFFEYLEKVNDNYEQYGTPECLDKIRNIFERYDQLMKTAEGIQLLKEEENICKDCDFTVEENQQLFLMFKIEDFMYNSQYGNTTIIRNHCVDIETSLSSKDQKKTSQPKVWLEAKQCFCYNFEDIIEEYRDEENDWILAWVYQTCTEFGYFQTMSSMSQPFTHRVDVDFYTKMCRALYGNDFDEERVEEGVEKVNKLYGGLQPNVTKIAFTNGDMDPWSTLSVLEDLSYDAPAVIIPRSSHCRDLFSDKESDLEELKEARKYVKYLIKKWIGAGDYLTTHVKPSNH